MFIGYIFQYLIKEDNKTIIEITIIEYFNLKLKE